MLSATAGNTRLGGPSARLSRRRLKVEALTSGQVRFINQQLVERSTSAIDRYQEDIKSAPKVIFRIRSQVNIGEGWKVCGSSSELGSWVPEVAPFMTWSTGDVWSTSLRLLPGTYEFKFVRRHGCGHYSWEEGEQRIVEVPEGLTAEDELEADTMKVRERALVMA